VPRAPEQILQRLDWTVLRRLDGVLQGDYRTIFRGEGLDLADIREYVAGDDVRYIDWNVTARMDAPYVREYLEDREITAHFLLDLSPSMDFGTAQAKKLDVLIDLVGVLSRVLTRHGNRVGAILYSGSASADTGRSDAEKRRPNTSRGGVERVIPARGGRIQVLRIIDELLRRPRLERAPFTSLAELLETAARTIRRRSLVFVVSDFITAPGWDRPLGQLARRHEVLAVRLVDPRERDLPDIGAVWMTDSETGEQLWIDTSEPRFRARFAEIARRREERLLATFARARVEVLSLSTEDDLVTAILRFAARRKLRRARRAGAAAGIGIRAVGQVG
jgi:uncharacterized protein (DUF58 family)